MAGSSLDVLDELLVRVRISSQRPAYRRRFLEGMTQLHGMTNLRLLRAVERRTAGTEAPSIGDVADELGIEQSSASRSVASAVDAGLLSKTPCAGDQRRSRVELTELGRVALAEMTQRRREMLAETVAAWSDAELAQLTTLLGRLADDLDGGLRA